MFVAAIGTKTNGTKNRSLILRGIEQPRREVVIVLHNPKLHALRWTCGITPVCNQGTALYPEVGTIGRTQSESRSQQRGSFDWRHRYGALRNIQIVDQDIPRNEDLAVLVAGRYGEER